MADEPESMYTAFVELRESVKGCFITAVEPLVMPIIRLLQRIGL